MIIVNEHFNVFGDKRFAEVVFVTQKTHESTKLLQTIASFQQMSLSILHNNSWLETSLIFFYFTVIIYFELFDIKLFDKYLCLM